MARAKPPKKKHRAEPDGGEARARILDAAYDAFMANGYAATSTLEIATRARVSKRQLYELVGNKEQMLVTCITERAKRLQAPGDLPVPRDRGSLQQLLAGVGTQLLREVTDPAVIGVFRLAIAEVVRAPEVARTLDSIGRQATRATIGGVMARAVAAGLIDGQPAELSAEFGSLLFGDVMIGLLLGVADTPDPKDTAARAQWAAVAFIKLHP